MSNKQSSDIDFRNDDGDTTQTPSTKNTNKKTWDFYSDVEITPDGEDIDEDDKDEEGELQTPHTKSQSDNGANPYSNVEITPEGKDIEEEDNNDNEKKVEPVSSPINISEKRDEIYNNQTKENTFQSQQTRKTLVDWLISRQDKLNNQIKSIKFPSILYFIISLLVCFLAFYLYTETLGILKVFRQSIFFPVILGGFIILVFLIIYFAVRIWIEIHKYKVNPQINIKSLEELSKNESDHLKYSQETEEAYQLLYDYVKAYPEYGFPPDKPTVPDYFSWEREELDSFNKKRNEILNTSPSQNGHGKYVEFQNMLDKIALKRVKDIAIKVSYQTALSPKRLFDSLIAFYWSYQLLKEMVEIYNVRMTDTSFLITYIDILSNVIIIGKVDDAGNVFEELTREQLQEYLPDISATLLSSLTSKMAEGGINYFLMRRIGKAMIARLQPIRND